MNFVCIGFELGDKMLTLSSMENLIVQRNQQDPWTTIVLCTSYSRAKKDQIKDNLGEVATLFFTIITLWKLFVDMEF